MHKQYLLNALQYWSDYIEKYFGGGTIVSLYSSLTRRSPLYGGRKCTFPQSLSYENVVKLNKNNIGVMVTLTNHHFSGEAYKATLPVLEKLHNPLNSATIVNDELARRLKTDFPDLKRKASVIKLFTHQEEIYKALELYDFVTLQPKLNNDVNYLQSLKYKEKIILFANATCLYKCSAPTCYKGVSDEIFYNNEHESGSCRNLQNMDIKNNYVIFNLHDARFAGFGYFKLVPSDHLTPDKQKQPEIFPAP